MKKLEGALLLRNRTSGIVAIASIPIVLGACVAAIVSRHDLPFMFASYAICPTVIALTYHLGWNRPKIRPARFEVSSGTLRVDGAMRRRRIARAKIIPQPIGRGTIVEVGRRFDPYPTRLVFPTLDVARDFVRALGLDAREGSTRFRGPLTEAVIFALLGAGAVFASVAYAALGVFGLLLAAVALVAFERFAIPTFTIGRDGILIERFLRKRFLPYAKVVALHREVRQRWTGQAMVSRGFWVILESGQRAFIDTTRERMRDNMFQGDHLFDAATEAHHLARTNQPRAADMLGRGGRPTKEWLRQLDGAREARYRVAALTDEELSAVLANPNADKTARAGAAICLARAGEAARGQVRIAAEDIAEPDVRKAALAALEDDEEALAAALESLE